MPVVSRYFTPNRVVYERVRVEGTEELVDDGTAEAGPVYQYLLVYPKQTTLQHRLHCHDAGFIDFVQTLLCLDPHARPSAEEVRVPWLTLNFLRVANAAPSLNH